MKICGIYKITSPSCRIYIGQSSNIKKRFSSYNSLRCKGQKRLYASFEKYGVENHKFEVIEECNIDQLNERERHWQEHYDVLSRRGLNCSLVETKWKSQVHIKETIEKIRIANTGKKFTKEHRKKLSDSKSGENHPMYGKKGRNHYNFGKRRTEKQKKLQSFVKTGIRHKGCKIVLDINTGVYYDYAKEASQLLNIKYSTLKSWLNGRSKNPTSLRYV